MTLRIDHQITVRVVQGDSDLNKVVKDILSKIINLQTTMATSHAQIKAEFDALKSAISEERTQILAKIQELQDTINSGDGGTEAERAALLEDIKAQVQAVKDIIPDPIVEPPVEPA